MTNDSLKNKLWVEKYRPKSIDQYIFQDPKQKASVKRYIADKSIPHLILSGVQGTGKTTLAQILIRAMELDDSDVKTINASDNRGIETFRDQIKGFATSMAMGRFKIVHLEEADKLTPDAQAALKSFMEENADYVRFIFTCNTVSKIIVPVRSRCKEFFFKSADMDDIAEYLVTILSKEKVKFDLDLVDKYMATYHPDIRKTLNELQDNVIDGVLQAPGATEETGDYKFKILDLIEEDKWVEIRKLVCVSVTAEEWENVYRFLYENLHRAPKFAKYNEKWEQAIVILAYHLEKHAFVADPEINAASMFIQLGQL